MDIDPFKEENNLKSVFLGINYYSEKIKKLEQENKELYLNSQELYKEINKLNEYLRKSVIGKIIKKLDKKSEGK